MNSNTNSRTGNWSAFGSSGRGGGFGRQATNDVHTSAFSRPAARGEGWSAFGGGQRDERADQRRQEREAEAAREAAEARAKKLAEEAAAKKLADATNFKSEDSYPALGAGGAGRAPKPALSWKAAAQAGAARAAEREAEEAAATAAAGGRSSRDAFYARVRPPTVKRTSSLTYEYEDDQPDEDGDDAFEPEHQRMAYAGDDSEEEGDGEFNADIVSGRRRGDKGIW